MTEIREIREPELKDLLGLYRDLHDEDYPLPDQSVVEAVWGGIRADPHQHYFGVFVDGALTASCVLVVVPNLTRGCRPYGIIENVVTRADQRRKGHGSAVLKAALAHAWKQGCYKAMLLTGRKNEGVFRFYESAGFDRHAKQAFLAKPGRRET